MVSHLRRHQPVAREGQRPQIAVAIAAASIVPSLPRVLVQIYKTNYSHDLIHGSGAFALHFLRRDQLDLIKDFGLVSGRDKDKLGRRAIQRGALGQSGAQ